MNLVRPFVSALFSSPVEDVTEVSGRLVQVAKKKGSTDNITVIVVFLRDPALIAKRPLPPAPVTPPPSAQATPTIEQQRKAFEAMAAELGWSGSDNDNSWQQNPDAQDPIRIQEDLPDAKGGPEHVPEERIPEDTPGRRMKPE